MLLRSDLRSATIIPEFGEIFQNNEIQAGDSLTAAGGPARLYEFREP
eukprot:COSAG05_NODE_8712_length_678_cov_1.295337_1_plen_46_part_10